MVKFSYCLEKSGLKCCLMKELPMKDMIKLIFITFIRFTRIHVIVPFNGFIQYSPRKVRVHQFKCYTLLLPFAVLTICPISILSQESDSVNQYTEMSNKIFIPDIKTVLFHREGWDMSPPLIKFNSVEKLKLSFDDLEADKKEYLYTIIHCDAGWKPSELRQNEYIDGYFEDDIPEFDFSVNTIVPYTHYELTFPTEDLIPKLSGNYILKVFIDQPDSLCFTRRFMIVDNKIGIEGRIKQASNNEDRYYKQEIDFNATTSGLDIINPFRDLKVVIIQNGRWDNALRNLKPKMAVGNKLDFDYDRENVFNGGNEFRSFDIKSLKYNTEFISRIEKDYSGYHIYLRQSDRRTFTIYKKQDDIDGMMKIKTEDSENTETEAEYVNVHFTLPYAAPMIDASMYIIGQVTDWQFSDESKMDYNYTLKAYEKTLLLKQGYYNYQYILRYFNQTAGDETFIEGNHSATGNSYTIYIYYYEPGSGYNRLAGVKHLNSHDD